MMGRDMEQREKVLNPIPSSSPGPLTPAPAAHTDTPAPVAHTDTPVPHSLTQTQVHRNKSNKNKSFINKQQKDKLMQLKTFSQMTTVRNKLKHTF